MAENIFANNEMESYKCDANEALTFKLVKKDGEEVEFKPDMCHQIFGNAESIFGYKDLQVTVNISACDLMTYITMQYKAKLQAKLNGEIEPDDVVALLGDKMMGGYTTDEKKFSNRPSDHSFQPFGSFLHSYTLKDPDTNTDKTYEVYHVEEATNDFKEWHKRMQILLLFYIDAASFIDLDDHKWHYFLLHEVYETDKGKAHSFVGYMSIYNYYAYPDLIRPRISQVLVLPPYQGRGHGSVLLQVFYKWTQKESKILDIAVEEPSEDFQRMRDYVDCCNSLKLVTSFPDNFTEKLLEEIKTKLKLSKKQAHRVHEILYLFSLKQDDAHYPAGFKAFRRRVVRRLNIPLQKNSRHFERLSGRLKPSELSVAMNHHSTQQRLQLLDQQFEELLQQYQLVVDKLRDDSKNLCLPALVD